MLPEDEDNDVQEIQEEIHNEPIENLVSKLYEQSSEEEEQPDAAKFSNDGATEMNKVSDKQEGEDNQIVQKVADSQGSSDDDEEEGEYIPHTSEENSKDHIIDENVESEQIAIQEQVSSEQHPALITDAENEAQPGDESEQEEEEVHEAPLIVM